MSRCACMGRPEVNLRGHSTGISTRFLRQDLWLTWTWVRRVGGCQEMPWVTLVLPSAGTERMFHQAWLFMWMLETEWAWCFCGKCFPNWAIFSASPSSSWAKSILGFNQGPAFYPHLFQVVQSPHVSVMLDGLLGQGVVERKKINNVESPCWLQLKV